MIDGQYPELDVHHFFPYWEEGDDMESIPAGFLENKITWPLCGYVPDTPDVILGLEQRWPYPPQPEQITNDSMQVDMSQSKYTLIFTNPVMFLTPSASDPHVDDQPRMPEDTIQLHGK
jgi:hypothetical protein